MLGVVSLIIALLGVGVGAFSFISMNNYINETNSYVPPMAKVYYDGPSYTILSGVGPTLFNYNQKSYDTHDAFDLPSDSYTIPEPGFYQVIAQCSIYADDGNFFMIQLLKNNVLICSRSSTASVNTNTFGVALSDINNFIEGDSLTIKLYQWNLGNVSRNIFDGEARTFLAITKIS